MNPPLRPTEPAPGGMRGSSRMHDPSEAAHDRMRRRCMNVAFLGIALLNAAQLYWVGVTGAEWITVLLLAIAAVPLGLAVKVFELRFKMAPAERRLALRELPGRRKFAFTGYAVVMTAVLLVNSWLATWALAGLWFYDFVTYYHDRPERMRHLYAVTKTLDELRDFPAPWAWPLPVLVWSVWRLQM